MSIEFRCTQCQRLLRTQDDAAGKQAKCPECGTILRVPTPETGSEAPPPPPPPSSPQPDAGPANPFASASPTGSPFGPGEGSGGTTQNPYQSPVDYMPGPVQAGPAGAITPTPIEVGDILSRTWTILKNQYGICLAVFIVGWLVNVGFSVVGSILQLILQSAGNDPVLAPIVSFVFQIAYWLFSTWIGVGVALCFLKIARGQSTSVGEVFSGGPYFWRILLGWILVSLALFGIYLAAILPAAGIGYLLGRSGEAAAIGALAGLLIGLIPGLAVMLGLFHFQYVVIDRNVGISESMSIAWQIARGNKLTIFAVGLLAGLLGIVVTVFTCGLGMILFAAPFWSLMLAVIYLAMSGQPTADRLYQQKFSE